MKYLSRSRVRPVFKNVYICRIEIHMCEIIKIRVFPTELLRLVHYTRYFALSYTLEIGKRLEVSRAGDHFLKKM